MKTWVVLNFLCQLVVFIESKNDFGKRPNIVFIMIDDYGYNDVGYHNNRIQTPNIDLLAKEGVRLENYYVQPICSPSRTSFLSGNYLIHTGQQHDIIHPGQPSGLPLHFKTVADRLKEGGYNTHMVGKWHAGMHTWKHTPLYRGFDTFYGYLLGSQGYRSHKNSGFLDFRDGMDVVYDDHEYSTFAYAKRSIRIINNSSSNEPFFLYLSFQAVHAPMDVPKEYEDIYKNIKNNKRRVFSGMVTCMDEAIGNVTNALKEKGILDNTVIILSTDNGGRNSCGGSNYPLRGEKHTLWEGGVHAVGLVHSKLLKKPSRVSNAMIHITDWYPTMLHLAGVETEDMGLDGYNVWKSISQGKDSPRTEIVHNIDPLQTPRGDLIYDDSFDHRMRAAIRVGKYKLLTGNPGDSKWFASPYANDLERKKHSHGNDNNKSTENLWLFDIENDPEERINLVDKYPHMVEHCLKRLAKYNSTAVPPTQVKRDPRSSPKNFGGVWTPWMESE